MDHTRDRPSRRRFVQGVGVVSLGLLAGCDSKSSQRPPAPESHGRPRRIGTLAAGPPPPGGGQNFAAFADGLRQLGYVDGQNVVLDYRWVEPGQTDFGPSAQELVQTQVDVILAVAPLAIRAA